MHLKIVFVNKALSLEADNVGITFYISGEETEEDVERIGEIAEEAHGFGLPALQSEKGSGSKEKLQKAQDVSGEVSKVKITIVYDNKVWKEGLEADWGFSCLVEDEKAQKILFDTGANGRILLSNMKKLDIDPFYCQEGLKLFTVHFCYFHISFYAKSHNCFTGDVHKIIPDRHP